MIAVPAVALVILILLGALLRPLLAAWLFTYPPRVPPADRTPADWGAAYEDVTLGSDGSAIFRMMCRGARLVFPARQ